MKNNFDISIPTIPSRTIKFKIQDIKSTAFGSQKNRFNENKGFLTKKFIQSFNNFSEKQPQYLQTEAQSRVQSYQQKQSQRQTEQDFRVFIPEQKKHMLHHMNKYKNYQMPILKETKYNRGYSFYRTDTSLLNPPKTYKNKDRSLSIQNTTVSDSFFFPKARERSSVPKKTHEGIPSCVFKNETRNRVYTKLDAQASKLGPGQYFTYNQKKEQVKKEKPTANQDEIDMKKLTKIISNIVGEQQELIDETAVTKEKEPKQDHMFIQDDRDRFGDQKYPISNKTQVPGPGAYEVKDSIENVAKKVVVVEEQRRLLKQWFNN